MSRYSAVVLLLLFVNVPVVDLIARALFAKSCPLFEDGRAMDAIVVIDIIAIVLGVVDFLWILCVCERRPRFDESDQARADNEDESAPLLTWDGDLSRRQPSLFESLQRKPYLPASPDPAAVVFHEGNDGAGVESPTQTNGELDCEPLRVPVSWFAHAGDSKRASPSSHSHSHGNGHGHGHKHDRASSIEMSEVKVQSPSSDRKFEP